MPAAWLPLTPRCSADPLVCLQLSAASVNCHDASPHHFTTDILVLKIASLLIRSQCGCKPSLQAGLIDNRLHLHVTCTRVGYREDIGTDWDACKSKGVLGAQAEGWAQRMRRAIG